MMKRSVGQFGFVGRFSLLCASDRTIIYDKIDDITTASVHVPGNGFHVSSFMFSPN